MACFTEEVYHQIALVSTWGGENGELRNENRNMNIPKT
jgi:hypothetical protein